MENNYNQDGNQPNNAQVQMAVDAAMATQKKKKRKKRLIILAVLVVLVIGVIAIAGSGDEDNGKKVEAISSSQSADGTAEEAQPDSEIPAVIEPGTAVTVDNLKISYVSCDADFKKYHEYADVDGGNKVIRAEFTFENLSERDISLDGFECYADNNKCEEFYAVDDYASPTLESVSPGRSFKAVVYYEVPKNAASIELETELDFWSSDKLIFSVK